VSAAANKDLVRRYFEAIDARRDASVLEEYVGRGFVDHSPSPGFTPDFDGLAGAFLLFLEATPDGRHEIEDMLAEGDRVATRVTAVGTHTGELFGIPPTNREFRTTSIVIHRIAEGKIVERWAEIDMMGSLIQLGVLAPPGAPASP
jgi:predicted ester cyclase